MIVLRVGMRMHIDHMYQSTYFKIKMADKNWILRKRIISSWAFVYPYRNGIYIFTLVFLYSANFIILMGLSQRRPTTRLVQKKKSGEPRAKEYSASNKDRDRSREVGIERNNRSMHQYIVATK
jgi:hypothetical protein